MPEIRKSANPIRKLMNNGVILAVLAFSILFAHLVALPFARAWAAAILVANPTSTIFINEIHYDNTGTDAGEFIEIAGPAGTDLTGYSIVLYNGTGGAVYDTDALTGVIPSQQGGYGTVSLAYAVNGIQNGAPDGIALVGPSGLIQFLCYEGTFAGVGGAANGQTCTDIGVTENGSEPLGQSLRLSGTGTTYGDFVWNAVAAHTSGAPNTGQTFTGGPTNPTLSVGDVTQAEGNAGTTVFTFTVSLTAPAPAVVTFDIATADSTAQDGNPVGEDNDYVAQSLTGQSIPAGSSGPFNFSVTVNGDTTVEANETFFVNVTNITNAANTSDQGVGTITNDDGAPVPVHDIQGNGAASPISGASVLVDGIVTAKKTNGFFLQERDADVDADPNTSEGIFVFTSSPPTANVGDLVNAVGTVAEFNELTEITNVTSVTVISSGNPLPASVTLTTVILDPAGPVDQLEKFEGMRMSAGSVRSVAPTNGFGEIYTVLDGVVRPLREPGIDITLPMPPDPTSGLIDCCIPRWDRNPERIMIDTDGLAGSSVLNVTSNMTLTNIVGPLDFTFGDYKVVPEVPPTPTSLPMAAVPVPDPLPDEFTVSGKNIENFANNATQRQKASLAIRTVEKLPDIIGVIEIADLASLQALATQVNDDTVAAGGANPAYQAFLIPAPQGGTQHVGFLVKASRVQVDSVTQERATETFVNPVNGSTETLHDRPPLVLQATLNPPAAPLPRRVIVVVNHTRSFIDIELVAGEGTRVREKRKRQGESIAGLLQELQTLNPGVPVIAVGDYNAYQFSDGYTDPIATIKGMPTADEQIVVDQSPDVVNPNFVNLTDNLPASERYSFIFEGTPQALDHIIVNGAASAILQRYAIARSNADFPESAPFTDVTRPESHSDHDSPVAYFSFPIPTAADASINGRVLTASGRGISNALVTVTDMNGGRVGSGTTNTFGFFTVQDLPVGNAYIVSVVSKRFSFDPSSQVIVLDDHVTGVDFTSSR